jgi:hypothetical protein
MGIELPGLLRGRIGLNLGSWALLPVQQFTSEGMIRYAGEFAGFRLAASQGYAVDLRAQTPGCSAPRASRGASPVTSGNCARC